MSEHEGEGHGSVTLSLTTETPAGGRLFESWVICECTADVLRTRLGPVQMRSEATAAETQAVARAALEHGGTHKLGGGH